MASNLELAHVVFQTSRIKEMRDFYGQVLGAHVVFETDESCLITFDEEHHRVAFTQPPFPLDNKSPTAAGLHHSAYTVASIDALLERYSELAAGGVQPAVCAQHGVTTSMYYLDPDGNFVEFQVDNFPTPEASVDYMEGPEYSADAAGPTFDPERMIQARHEGVDVGVVSTRTWALAGTPPMGVMEAFGAALANYASARS
ncbi:VOC family protein [Mycobacterium sp.]|uniref:VOC family protein n=1 Tax=Mycobacterium sp. TaxID=1785 RepID=UPI003D147177